MDPAPRSTDALSRALTAGDAVLTQAAATLRGMGAGASVTIAAAGVRRTFRIGAVVDDKVGRGRELIIPLRMANGLGLTAPRALVTSVEGEDSRAALDAIKEMTAGVLARIQTGDQNVPDPTEGPILSFAEVKQIFGEFVFKPRSGLFVAVDKAWYDANIVDTTVPLL
jgi:hypothetical protein